MNRLRHLIQNREGFTLAELVVVVAIIGVLLAIAVPLYMGFTGQAQQAKSDLNAHVAAVQTAGDQALAP